MVLRVLIWTRGMTWDIAGSGTSNMFGEANVPIHVRGQCHDASRDAACREGTYSESAIEERAKYVFKTGSLAEPDLGPLGPDPVGSSVPLR